MYRKIVAMIFAAAMLVGCSSSSATEKSEVETKPDATESPSNEASSDEAPAAIDQAPSVCATLNNRSDPLVEEIADLIINMPAQLTDENIAPYVRVSGTLNRAIRNSPDHYHASIEKVLGPFAALADLNYGGGHDGAISIDTSQVTEGIMELTALCVEDGYRIDD